MRDRRSRVLSTLHVTLETARLFHIIFFFHIDRDRYEIIPRVWSVSVTARAGASPGSRHAVSTHGATRGLAYALYTLKSNP